MAVSTELGPRHARKAFAANTGQMLCFSYRILTFPKYTWHSRRASLRIRAPTFQIYPERQPVMQRATRRIGQLYLSQDGGILITWAILLPVFLGMAGMGLDTGSWYLAKRNLQAAVDGAAISAAYESTGSARTSTANSVVVSNGFGNGSNVTITVNNPPKSGTYTANNNAVEVILSQPQNTIFSGFFPSAKPTIKVRSVALSSSFKGGDACVLTLATTGTAINITSNATMSMSYCTLTSNSTDPASITLANNSNTTVSTLYTAGKYTQSGSSTLNTSTTPVQNGTPTADPFTSLGVSMSGAVTNGFTSSATQTISPGVYKNGMTFNSGAKVTMNPGTYYVDQGSFSVNSGATLTGSGVTIVLTSSSSSNYATASIKSGSTVTLSDPSNNGTYAGILFYQDRNAPVGSQSSLSGGATMNLTGTLYFPQGALTYSGSAGNSGNGNCDQIVANTVSFTGTTKLTENCQVQSGIQQIDMSGKGGTVKLVE